MPQSQDTKRPSKSSNNERLGAFIVSSVNISSIKTPATPPLSKKRCLYLCKWISKACNFHLFAKPVDWEALGLWDYPHIVQHAMDFQTLTTYISSVKEFDFTEFLKKSRLIWANACMYNPVGHPVNAIAQRLSNEFEKKMVQMQCHAEDDDSTNISNQLQSLILGLQEEEFSQHFIQPVDFEICTSYAEHINVPYCLEYILDDLSNVVYGNRYDAKDDVDLIVSNAIIYNSERSFVGVAAKTLKEVSERLFQSRLPELDSFYFITSDMRHQLLKNLSMIDNEERLKIMSDVMSICPDALICVGSTTSFSVDMLSRKQFISIDCKIRHMLANDSVRM